MISCSRSGRDSDVTFTQRMWGKRGQAVPSLHFALFRCRMCREIYEDFKDATDWSSTLPLLSLSAAFTSQIDCSSAELDCLKGCMIFVFWGAGKLVLKNNRQKLFWLHIQINAGDSVLSDSWDHCLWRLIQSFPNWGLWLDEKLIITFQKSLNTIKLGIGIDSIGRYLSTNSLIHFLVNKSSVILFLQ